MAGLPHQGGCSQGQDPAGCQGMRRNMFRKQTDTAAQGSTSSRHILKLAREAKRQNMLGVMVWYCSVVNGLKYAENWDCTGMRRDMFSKQADTSAQDERTAWRALWRPWTI